jgi:hypothetical protein
VAVTVDVDLEARIAELAEARRPVLAELVRQVVGRELQQLVEAELEHRAHARNQANRPAAPRPASPNPTNSQPADGGESGTTASNTTPMRASARGPDAPPVKFRTASAPPPIRNVHAIVFHAPRPVRAATMAPTAARATADPARANTNHLIVARGHLTCRP